MREQGFRYDQAALFERCVKAEDRVRELEARVAELEKQINLDLKQFAERIAYFIHSTPVTYGIDLGMIAEAAGEKEEGDGR